MNVNCFVFGSYTVTCREFWTNPSGVRVSGYTFADGWPDAAAQYAGGFFGERTCAVKYTRPSWSIIGLCAFTRESHTCSVPKYGDGATTGFASFEVGASSSRIGTFSVVLVIFAGSRTGKSSVLSSAAPKIGP